MIRCVTRPLLGLLVWLVLAALLWSLLIPRPRFYLPDKHIFFGFSPDSRRMVTARLTDGGGFSKIAGPLSVWDCRTGERCCEIPCESIDHETMQFSPDGTSIAIASSGVVTLFNLKTGQPGLRSRFDGGVRRLYYRPDGVLLVFCGSPMTDRELQVLQFAPRRVVGRIGPVHWFGRNTGFDLTPDGLYAMTVGSFDDHVLQLSLLFDQVPLVAMPFSRLPTAVYLFGDLCDAKYGQARSHNITLRFREKGESILRFWDLQKGCERSSTILPYVNWPFVGLSPDGNQAAITRRIQQGDKSVPRTELYDAQTGKMLQQVASAAPELIDMDHRLSFSKDSKTLFVNGMGRQSIDLTTDEPTERGLTIGGAYAPDGSVFAQEEYKTVGPQILGIGEKKDFAVVVNRLPSGDEILRLIYPNDAMATPLVFSPDGRFLVLKVISEGTPNSFQEFISSLQQWLQGLGWMAGQSGNLSALSNDIRVVEITTGREVASLNSPGLIISFLCSYSPDGQTLRLGDVIWDGVPHRPSLWILGPPVVPAFLCMRRWRRTCASR